jgi:hypothetical protein
MPDKAPAEIAAAGRTLALSNPAKTFFPERGETKLDLANYYLAIEQPLMRALGGRPVLMERYPDGAGGSSFFQKRVPKNAPDWLQTTTVQTPNGTPSEALVAADVAHIVWAVNLGCIGLHVWPYLAADPDHTDELRIDLDPSPGVDLAMVKEAATETRALLAGLLFCKSCNRPMIPTYTAKLGRRFRYYVCQKARQNGWHSCPTKSVPAALIEDSVVAQLRGALSSEEIRQQFQISETAWQVFEQGEPGELVRAVVEHIAYDGITGAVTLTLAREEGTNDED